MGRDKLSAFFVGSVEVVKDPLLLSGNVRRVGVDNIKSPFTLGNLLAQQAGVLLLHKRSNVIHILLIFSLGAFTTAFSRMGVEDIVAYYLSILDHGEEVMFDTFVQVGLPLFIGFDF
jgi:hypothetical protein